MKSTELKEWVDIAKKRPLTTALVAMLLTGGSGASIGAFATKAMVDEKHVEAMTRINSIEKEQGRTDQRMTERLDRIENKVDRILLRGR